MKSTEQLESEFDAFAYTVGFKRVSDFVGNSPDFANADYINDEEKIIIELKIIDKNFFEVGGIIDRLQTIVTIPKNIDLNGFGQYEFILPNINREGRYDTMEEPLRRILKKANRQIKETKDRLLDGNGVGFVLIALNMERIIDPEVIRSLAGEILSREFSAINGFIICTPGYGLYNPVTRMAHSLCLPTTPYEGPEEIRSMCNKIGQAWIEFSNNGGHIGC